MPEGSPYVQGFCLWPDGKAESIGMTTLLYEKWKLIDADGAGKIVLAGKSIGNGQTIDFSDTLDIISVSKDSLVIGNDGYRAEYVKSSGYFDGTYSGTIPAADCPGIKVTVALRNDGSFHIIYDYLERDNVFESDGDYSVWGDKVMAVGNDGDSVFFRLEGNNIRLLDREMNAITGAAADMFVLYPNPMPQ